MTTPIYIVRADLAHHPFAITMDDVSFRAPFYVRVTWKPAAIDSAAAALIPDWCNGSPAVSLRDYDNSNTTRWFVRAREYGFRDVELITNKEGERIKLSQVKPPQTRTRGRWFTWECGRWVDKPNHDYHQACYVRARAEYWHTPPWEPGANMAAMPPTDPTYADQKAQP